MANAFDLTAIIKLDDSALREGLGKAGNSIKNKVNWWKKYRDAFFTGKPDESYEEESEPTKPKRFEDLFTVTKKG